MELNITSDIAKLQQQLQFAAARVPIAAEAGIDRAAQIVKQQSDRQLRKIYARSIPSRAQASAYNSNGKRIVKKNIGRDGGKLAWQRSGQLAAGETIVRNGPYERVITTTGPAAKYANRRQGLGVYWQPKKPAIGIVRLNPWRQDALRITAPQVNKVFEIEMKRQLRTR